ncbi:putative transcription factor interactor and regulator CCHC(Zn) family [Helianthus annuus]|nr:putative transcription factor interactor and regulator CCHC(Zn) family [Helianthus annuus]
MPPRRSTNTNPLPRERISQAIAQYEANRSEQSGGTSGNNPPVGCTYKQFLDCKLLNFDGTGGAVAFVRWIEKTDSVLRMSKCLPEQRVTYISGLFLDGVLSWWNLQVQTKGETAAYAMSWDELKEIMRKKYCSRAEIQKLETEFWNLKMIGSDIAGYIQRFHDISRVGPYLVDPEFKQIERFIWGLAPEILSMVTSSKPPTISEAIDLAVALTEEAPRLNKFSKLGSNKKETHVEFTSDNKRKFSNFKKGTRANNNNSNKRREVNPPAKPRTGTTTNATGGKGYAGFLPKCDRCRYHHTGPCKTNRCENCGKIGHSKETCWSGTGRGNRNQGGNGNQGGNNNNNRGGNGNGRGQGCYGCGDKGHYRKDCPKENQARGRVFTIGAREARQDPNVVTGTFPINQHFASVLFDIGADFSFISIEFKNLLGLESSKLDVPYSIELANGKLVEAGKVIKGCTLELGERKFSIDLLPVDLGSFDVVVGMDWLSDNRA